MTYSTAFPQALLALMYITDKLKQGDDEFIATRQLAKALDIAPATTAKMLQSLNRAGLIETREGARGGVRLAVAPEQVKLLTVFDAIERERPLFNTGFRMGVQGRKPTNAQRAVLASLQHAEAAMKASLSETTLAELLASLDV